MSKFRNIVLPATTTPSSPKDGQIYHDSTLNQIRVYIDGSWISLGTGTNLNLPTTSQLYIHNERFNGGSSAQVKFESGSIFMHTYG
jgi:hypothetical protein